MGNGVISKNVWKAGGAEKSASPPLLPVNWRWVQGLSPDKGSRGQYLICDTGMSLIGGESRGLSPRKLRVV